MNKLRSYKHHDICGACALITKERIIKMKYDDSCLLYIDLVRAVAALTVVVNMGEDSGLIMNNDIASLERLQELLAIRKELTQ